VERGKVFAPRADSTICLIANELLTFGVLAWLVPFGTVGSVVGTWCIWWAGENPYIEGTMATS
jgi:hypothetical protein